MRLDGGEKSPQYAPHPELSRSTQYLYRLIFSLPFQTFRPENPRAFRANITQTLPTPKSWNITREYCKVMNTKTPKVSKVRDGQLNYTRSLYII